MSVPAKRAAAMDASAYDVLWGTDTLGWMQDLDQSGIKPLMREKRIGELDDRLVDIEIYGLEGTIKIELHEVDSERVRQIAPWATASGAFTVTPTVNAYSMYANSKPLLIHPKNITGTASDWNWLHAFPVFTPPKSAGGKVWRKLMVEFYLFLDQPSLLTSPATNAIGYQGPLPA